MSDQISGKVTEFLRSPVWRVAFTRGDLNTQVTAIEAFLSALDSEGDAVDIYCTLDWLFHTYVTHGAILDAIHVLARIDDLLVPEDDDQSFMIARTLFDRCDELVLAEKYVKQALKVGKRNWTYYAAVNSLYLAVEVKKDPGSAKVQELLKTICDLTIWTQFFSHHLLEALSTLVPMGLVKWWGRAILEALWARRAVNERFLGGTEPSQKRESLPTSAILVKIVELHALLPASSRQVPPAPTSDING